MAQRPCLDCGALSSESRCPRHRATQEQAKQARRGTTTQRGYGAPHQALRREITKRMGQGVVYVCARCHQPVRLGQAWDLGHTDDRSAYTGPEHAVCNRSGATRFS